MSLRYQLPHGCDERVGRRGRIECTSLICRLSVPNKFEILMRAADPPMLVWSACRTVRSLKAVLAPPTCGATDHVPVQDI